MPVRNVTLPFTSHRAIKTWDSQKLFYSNIFYQNNDSKWFTTESFVSLFIWNDHQPKSIASDSANEFCQQLALNDNPEYLDLSRQVLPESLQ